MVTKNKICGIIIMWIQKGDIKMIKKIIVFILAVLLLYGLLQLCNPYIVTDKVLKQIQQEEEL